MQRGRRRGGSRRTLLLLLLLTAAWALAAGPAPAGAAAGAPAAANVHTVFLTDCTPYSDWQTAVMVFGWRESGQPGALTRVMCCTPEEEAAYRELRGALLRIVDTHIAPSFARNPRTGDAYPPYNKPGGVAHWLNTTPPPEDWILVLDSDMILRRPFDPDDYMHLSRGWATGARYDYLIGVDNELAERHIPGAPRRNDSLAGPPGRRADRIGGFYFIHREDLARVAPLWLKYAEDVRDDPEAWHLSGDFYSKTPGERPWISEMYGYVFGAATVNISHKWDEISMIYPGYMPQGVPRILHYGLLWNVEHEGGEWSFDKHWFSNFDVTVCPPWEDTSDRALYGLFPAPPLPGQLRQNLTKAERYRDLISIEVVHTLNAAVCVYHLSHCPPSEVLVAACTRANAAYQDTIREVRRMDAEMMCTDANEKDCPNWARAGECDRNPAFMHGSCRLSCKLCTRTGVHAAPGSGALSEQLSKLAPAERATHDTPVITIGALPPESAGGVAVADHDAAAAAAQAALDSIVQRPDSSGHDSSSGAHSGGSAAAGGQGAGSSADEDDQVGRLRRRCFKWSRLSMQQVKDCVAAAQQGVTWQLDEPAGAGGGGGGGSSRSSGRSPSADGGRVVNGARRSGEVGRGVPASRDAGSSSGGGGGSGGLDGQQPGLEPTKTAEEAAQPVGLHNRASLGGAFLAWVGIVGMFLSLLPILYRRTKRRKSLPDRGPKLNV